MKGSNIILIFLLATLLSVDAYSQMCKRHVIDCPGICGRFKDSDGDKICDFSPRSKPAQKTDSLPKAKAEPKQTTATTTAVEESKQKAGVAAAASSEKTEKVTKETTAATNKDGVQKVADTTPVMEKKQDSVQEQATTAVQPEQKEASEEPQEEEKPYPLLLICGITLGLYALTTLLVKFGTIKKQTHRKIWNVALLVTFMMSGLLGFFLVVQLNYHIVMDWYMQLLKLHVEFGIAMAIISVFHTWWHLSYYMNMFKAKKKKEA